MNESQKVAEKNIQDTELITTNKKSDVMTYIRKKVLINKGKINVGSTVTVRIVTSDNKAVEKQYKIVGSNEADPRSGKISDESAVGKALMGRTMGAEVDVETQRGIVKYFIISVA